MDLFTPIIVFGLLMLVLATLLALGNRWLFVFEDPRIDQIEAMLPHTNCGGCGYPGCRPFAEALHAGDVLPGKCSVSSPAAQERIAAFLGLGVGAEEKKIARLACAGGSNVARNHARYSGLSTCAAAALVAGGGKGCFWGCLGLADCNVACTFDAISMDEHHLPVVDESRCTACGDCVQACPKDLFSLQPQSHRLWVACASLEAGDELLECCEVACTACARCVGDAPDTISMHENLPVIDYGKGNPTPAAIQSCPTGAIVWLDKEQGPRKGANAHFVIRRSDRFDGPT